MANLISVEMPSLFGVLLANMGDSITYTPPAGTAQSITAIVTDATNLSEYTPGACLIVEARSSDFTATPVQGATVTYGGASYYVQSVDVDLHGWAKLGCTKKA